MSAMSHEHMTREQWMNAMSNGIVAEPTGLYLSQRNLNDTLEKAAEYGHRLAIEKLLQLGATSIGWAIVRAIENGHDELVNNFLLPYYRNQPKGGMRQAYDNNILTRILGRFGMIDLFKSLYGFSRPGGITSFQATAAVHEAAMRNHGAMVELLIQHGAKPSEAAAYAARGGHKDLLLSLMDRYMLNNNSTTQQLANRYKFDLNHIAAMAAAGGQYELVMLLIERGAMDYQYIFENVSMHESIPLIEMLLNNNVNVNSISTYSAAYFGTLNVVKMLMSAFDAQLSDDKQSNVHHRERTDLINNVLAAAAASNKVEIVQYAIEEGATDFDRGLADAAAGNQLEMVRRMLKHGASDLKRALVRAANAGHVGIVQFLIKYDMDNRIHDKEGLSDMIWQALTKSIEEDRIEVSEYLMSVLFSTEVNTDTQRDFYLKMLEKSAQNYQRTAVLAMLNDIYM